MKYMTTTEEIQDEVPHNEEELRPDIRGPVRPQYEHLDFNAPNPIWIFFVLARSLLTLILNSVGRPQKVRFNSHSIEPED